MKILRVHRQFAPAVGGIESVVSGLSYHLAQLGYQNDVVTLRTIFTTGEHAPPTSSLHGIQVYRVPYLGGKRYTFAPAVWSFLAPYDIIHIHAVDFFVDFLAATRHRHRKPLVLNTHGGFFHTRWLLPLKKLYFHVMTRLMLQNVDAIICDSQHDERLFRAIVPPSKLSVIPNGVNVHAFRAITKHIEPGLLVGIGRIAENKKIDRCLRLLARLQSTQPNIRLIWVGPDSEGRIPILQSLAHQLGVGNRVQFVGYAPEPELCALLARAHLFLSVASYEAFGVSTIEAMSSGTVPIVTPVGIHPEVVHHGSSGFLLHQTNDDDAAACLDSALSLPIETITDIGRNAQQQAMRFSWERVVESYLAVYTSVLQRRGDV